MKCKYISNIMIEDEMVGWHHWLDGHEFEQSLGVGDRQGTLACWSPWGHKDQTWLSDWTEQNWTVACQASLAITNFWSLLKLHRVGDAILPPHPRSSPSPPAFNLSQHQGLSNESVFCIWWPEYWSFSFSISPSNEYSGLISFRMELSDLFAVQGTLKSLLQYHSSKASILGA